MTVKTMAEATASGIEVEVLFWVGCAGSFDARAQKVTKAFVQLLEKAGVSFAILGNEEMCTGDPCLLYTSPSPRDRTRSRMPSSA